MELFNEFDPNCKCQITKCRLTKFVDSLNTYLAGISFNLHVYYYCCTYMYFFCAWIYLFENINCIVRII